MMKTTVDLFNDLPTVVLELTIKPVENGVQLALDKKDASEALLQLSAGTPRTVFAELSSRKEPLNIGFGYRLYTPILASDLDRMLAKYIQEGNPVPSMEQREMLYNAIETASVTVPIDQFVQTPIQIIQTIEPYLKDLQYSFEQQNHHVRNVSNVYGKPAAEMIITPNPVLPSLINFESRESVASAMLGYLPVMAHAKELEDPIAFTNARQLMEGFGLLPDRVKDSIKRTMLHDVLNTYGRGDVAVPLQQVPAFTRGIVRDAMQNAPVKISPLEQKLGEQLEWLLHNGREEEQGIGVVTMAYPSTGGAIDYEVNFSQLMAIYDQIADHDTLGVFGTKYNLGNSDLHLTVKVPGMDRQYETVSFFVPDRMRLRVIDLVKENPNLGPNFYGNDPLLVNKEKDSVGFVARRLTEVRTVAMPAHLVPLRDGEKIDFFSPGYFNATHSWDYISSDDVLFNVPDDHLNNMKSPTWAQLTVDNGIPTMKPVYHVRALLMPGENGMLENKMQVLVRNEENKLTWSSKVSREDMFNLDNSSAKCVESVTNLLKNMLTLYCDHYSDHTVEVFKDEYLGEEVEDVLCRSEFLRIAADDSLINDVVRQLVTEAPDGYFEAYASRNLSRDVKSKAVNEFMQYVAQGQQQFINQVIVPCQPSMKNAMDSLKNSLNASHTPENVIQSHDNDLGNDAVHVYGRPRR